MVLILRKSDMKLISCSTKKCVCHESVDVAPLSYSSSTLKALIQQQGFGQESIDATVQADKTNEDEENLTPSHVQSIESMSSHTLPFPNSSDSHLGPIKRIEESAAFQSLGPGEGLQYPEHLGYEKDLQAGLAEMKKNVERAISIPASEIKSSSRLPRLKMQCLMSWSVDSLRLEKGIKAT
jgi:hypothetical protein